MCRGFGDVGQLFALMGIRWERSVSRLIIEVLKVLLTLLGDGGADMLVYCLLRRWSEVAEEGYETPLGLIQM
jgi:hypothetical protein